MILKEITIENYRKFSNATFSLDDELTLLAGSNNSGKTSIIELISNILCNSKIQYSSSNIPVKIAKEWCDKVYPILIDCFEKNEAKDEIIPDFAKKIFLEDEVLEGEIDNRILISPTLVKLKVDYTLGEDIRNFADYIMDFDINSTSLYFAYTYKPTLSTFMQALDINFEKIYNRYLKIVEFSTDVEKVKILTEILKEKLLTTYTNSIIEICHFTDSSYVNNQKMDISDFKKLFNFKNINAGRPLDDQNTGRTRNLSKNMIELAGNDDDWKKMIGELPDKILQPIEDMEITKLVRKTSIDGLSDAIVEISKVNGGNNGEMVLDLDISEDIIGALLSQITNAKYHIEGHVLSEASQGLGFSNMIFMLLQLEKYKRSVNPLVINIFVIEEPESHMHPQMQSVFIKYLKKYYKEKKIQGLMTTHSSEMVKVTDMKNLRVSRPIGTFMSEMYDFSFFKKSIVDDPILNNFYDWFYEIGFSDIVFADRVILYEGDTERMLIRKLATFEEFKSLNSLYIAFVQVGGAYAHNYRNLIEFLKIKTLILTDIDYDKSALDEASINSSETSNATLNNFYSINNVGIKPKIEDLFRWKKNNDNILFDNCAYVTFQGESDRYARTLEEAMLAKKYQVNVFENKEKTVWKSLRNEDGLKYTLPRDTDEFSIRDIVIHTSGGKTDFMYSVILKSFIETMLPDYIKEGLIWLME